MNQKTSNVRKQKVTLIIATLSFILLLTGSFTWASLSQRARNQIRQLKDEINPTSGGRIHDDFDGENKDVYAENFGESNLLVRIMLLEYMDIDNVPIIAGTSREDKTTWVPNVLGVDNDFRNYVEWTRGGEKVFMPTLNTDPKNAQVDASGIAIDDITGGQTAPGNGSHSYWIIGDIHPDFDPESGDIPRPAKATLSPELGGYMSMQDWIDADNPKGNFWVIDTDGWAYWANILEPGEATSLLLDSINMFNIPQEDWYYGINVIGEFATEFEAEKFADMSDNAKGLVNNLVEKRYLIAITNVPNTVVQGTTQQLNAVVSKDGIPLDDASVIWSIVSPHAVSTKIDTDGLLIIANDEESELIVRATYNNVFYDVVILVSSS
jgi:hypothetical protein